MGNHAFVFCRLSFATRCKTRASNIASTNAEFNVVMASVSNLRTRRQRSSCSRDHGNRFTYFPFFCELIIVVRGLCSGRFQLRITAIGFVAFNGQKLRFNEYMNKMGLRKVPFLICPFARYIRNRVKVTRYFTCTCAFLRKTIVMVGVILFNGFGRFSRGKESCRTTDKVSTPSDIPLRFKGTISRANCPRTRLANSRVMN